MIDELPRGSRGLIVSAVMSLLAAFCAFIVFTMISSVWSLVSGLLLLVASGWQLINIHRYRSHVRG